MQAVDRLERPVLVFESEWVLRYTIEKNPNVDLDAIEKKFERKKQRELTAARMAGAGGASEPTQRQTGQKVGRNDPCPCGSGKKFKKCHGAEA